MVYTDDSGPAAAIFKISTVKESASTDVSSGLQRYAGERERAEEDISQRTVCLLRAGKFGTSMFKPFAQYLQPNRSLSKHTAFTNQLHLLHCNPYSATHTQIHIARSIEI